MFVFRSIYNKKKPGDCAFPCMIPGFVLLINLNPFFPTLPNVKWKKFVHYVYDC
jgi:hypothetical protein